MMEIIETQMQEQKRYSQFRDLLLRLLERAGCPISPPQPLAHPHIKTNFMMSLAVTLLPTDSLKEVQQGKSDYGVIQPCIRIHDARQVLLDTVPWHLTFFEMLGAIIGGARSRQRTLEILFEILLGPIGLNIRDLRFRLYSGRMLPGISTDFKTLEILNSLGVSDIQIEQTSECLFGLREGEQVAGPRLEVACAREDSEMKEIATAVFLDFVTDQQGKMHELSTPVAEVGIGLERAYCTASGQADLTRTEPLASIVEMFGFPDRRASLLAADRMRAIAHAIGAGVVPCGRGRGYEIRKFLRDVFSVSEEESMLPLLRDVVSLIVSQYQPNYSYLNTDRVIDIIRAEYQHEKERQST